MRDDYLAPLWAEHHGQWSDFVTGAIRRLAMMPADLARRARPSSADPCCPRHKEA